MRKDGLICPHCRKELTIAESIAAARQAAGLTQARAARLCGETRQNWWAIESGRRIPRPAKLIHLFIIIQRHAKKTGQGV